MRRARSTRSSLLRVLRALRVKKHTRFVKKVVSITFKLGLVGKVDRQDLNVLYRAEKVHQEHLA